jgi:hypothetical protein
MRAFVIKAVEERNLVIEITHILQGDLREPVPKGYFLVLTDSVVKASLPRLGGKDYYSAKAAFVGRFFNLDGTVKNYQSTKDYRLTVFRREKGYFIRFEIDGMLVRPGAMTSQKDIEMYIGFDGYVSITMDGYFHYSGLVRNFGI